MRCRHSKLLDLWGSLSSDLTYFAFFPSPAASFMPDAWAENEIDSWMRGKGLDADIAGLFYVNSLMYNPLFVAFPQMAILWLRRGRSQAPLSVSVSFAHCSHSFSALTRIIETVQCSTVRTRFEPRELTSRTTSGLMSVSPRPGPIYDTRVPEHGQSRRIDTTRRWWKGRR